MQAEFSKLVTLPKIDDFNGIRAAVNVIGITCKTATTPAAPIELVPFSRGRKSAILSTLIEYQQLENTSFSKSLIAARLRCNDHSYSPRFYASL